MENKIELVRPEFCTSVMPDEYDFIGQFNEAMREANKFHSKMKIDENMPPPYYPIDMGKLYGLLYRLCELENK